MSRTKSIQRLATAVATLPVHESPALQAPVELEAQALGRELAQAVVAEMCNYKTESPPPATPDFEIAAIRRKLPSEVSFGDIAKLGRLDQEEMHSLWEKLKSTASDELATGWHAGQAIESPINAAWERACFLAIRTAYLQTWPPRSPGESLLIDELSQYEMLRHRWLRILTSHSAAVQTLHRQNKVDDAREARLTITQAAATREAILMIDRLQRIAQRTLRLLISLRRATPTLIVRQAGQVNLSTGQQLNVGAMDTTVASGHRSMNTEPDCATLPKGSAS